MSRFRLIATAISLILVGSACTPAASPSSSPPTSSQAATPLASVAPGQQFAGVEVNVLTFTGPQIAEPLQRHAPEFAALTGATINVTTVPFNELYQKILTDISTGTNSYQAFVFDPQWMGDFVTPGYLEDLSARVTADPTIKWEDVGPFFRDFSATYQGKVYAIPLDGDFHMVYYRKDILDKDGVTPPETWDDYLAIAKQYHGQDLNGDGQGDYGSCISKKRGAQAYWWITSIAGAWIQTQGTSQGAFFNTDDMTPLVKNDGFAAALDFYKESVKYAEPTEVNDDVGATRGLFTSGRCALSMDWGDIGTLAIDPATSKVQDKVGSIILPGSKQVVDRATGKLVDCDATTCPHAVNGVNHAPFAAYGGWSGAINSKIDAKVKDAAYGFLAYVSAPEQSNKDVTIGSTGFNPYRISQFSDTSLWIQAGMSEAAAKNYLGAIQASLESPNMILDLRIPKTQQYQQVVLDQALAQFLADEISRDEAMQQIFDGWEEITNTEGRDQQLAAYTASLGVQR
ncbi:MAG TPA: extracellular solute-binding protein [Candidatus Limnocylindrales bacterium]|nr:extracellular solute-binding protein [Candidatus Limnocylindrales bacterium]